MKGGRNWWCLLLVTFVVWNRITAGDGTNSSRGLFPNVFNLATNAIITVNATCGETGPEVYCKLVEHVYNREPQCGVCDASGASPEKHHPITQSIDGTNRWWQSPTLQNGKQYEWVTITIDLGQVFQVAYVIVKTAISPRPGNWILERSIDGVIYKPWQYYAISDTECWEMYGIRPTVGQPRYRSDNEVICTSYYSKLNPLENGEIHTSLVNGRPGVDGPTDKLRDFTRARYVRLRLQKIRTLNADLMTLQTDDPEKIDKSVTRRYFYSIKDISIGGQCVCYGHAKDCPADPINRKQYCKCEHNTCGENCDRCCPLFNQKLWRAGTSTDGAECEKCQCFGHADECYYDQNVADKHRSLNAEGKYEGGGVCKNCKHQTTGINCEQCEDGYYRPAGVLRNDSNPCRKCQCTGPGMTGNCVKDESHLVEGLKPGGCLCKVGFTGPNCDQCAIGYRNYPHCHPCPCHSAGTVGGTTCEGECDCLPNVEGPRCDRCKPGYYHLSSDNPEGCSQCFCFGITDECVEGDWGIEVVQKMEDWRVTDLEATRVVTPTAENGQLVIANDDMGGRNSYYWLAPPDYLGKKLYSYGADLKFGVSYVVARGDTSGTYTEGVDVIIEGNGVRLGSNWGIRPEEDEVIINMPLREQGWFVMALSGGRASPVNRETFTMALNNLTRLLIRAKFHSDQIEGALHNVGMETASKESSSLKKLKGVEKCICPPGYVGLSCELCASGYRRVASTLPGGRCERCDCYNHAESCDDVTGRCEKCLHHTTGSKCDRCLPGYYGNARIGTSEDCKRCACPLEQIENNFSPTCIATVTTAGEQDYKCDACPQGYEGDKCERCSEGYFGNPKVPGGYCQPCDCSGNIDTSVSGWCDKLTGQCLKCIGNTGGWNCGECLPGHYGNAQHRTCRPCNCNSHGSLSPQCDRTTGQCLCKSNYDGRTCDRCVEGYGNIEAGCVPCWCNREGARSEVCDPVSGRCHCKPGVFGTRCESCLEGHYGFSNEGCRVCSCNPHGSHSPQCDESTGQCACKPHVGGRSCDRCEGGYWNLQSGQGCEDCNCNKTGIVSPVCDQTTGQCSCRPGVGGKYCEQCLPGHYGFTSRGCKKCDPCDSPGRICDPKNGRCVCPPYTTGSRCQKCESHAWGYDPVYGCKPCNCSIRGSPSQACDAITGNCLCLEGFEGRHCDRCRHGYYNFPNCLKCDCHAAGTNDSHCSPEYPDCQCDDRGQCPCKTNVIGRTCDHCKEGAFGLASNNVRGCYDCFCFGKTPRCSQANMAWSRIIMPSREAKFGVGETDFSTLQGFIIIPGHSGNMRVEIPYVVDKPLYWSLPEEFLKDKVLSYNGVLRFQTESHSGSHFPSALLHRYPLVVLQGNQRLVLTHSVPYQPGGGQYEVKLHEDEWKLIDNPQIPVSRTVLMVALQNLQFLLIRATDGPDVKYARFWNVSLDVAAETHLSNTAEGIEMCRCPRQYKGSSCQDPAMGYYRKHKPNYLDSKDVLDLVGWAEPCACNNHSRICEIETGVCINCTGNTMGPNCNICVRGYYGDPSRGPCRPCACPLPTNSFSDTCQPDGSDYICIDCRPGYTGRYCDKCADGYYGNPSIEGGSCRLCECNPYGSYNRICDKQTGQCACHEGITGRECTVCRHGYILTEYGCKSCDDECTGILLDEVYALQRQVELANLTDLPALPWGYLSTLENTTAELKIPVEEYERKVSLGKQLVNNFTFYFDLQTQADLLYIQARDLKTKAPLVAADAQEALEDAQQLLLDLEKTWKELQDLVDLLRKHGLESHRPGASSERVLAEAERMLREIKSRDFKPNKEDAERELRKALNLLDRVKKLTMDRQHLDDLNHRLDRLDELLNDLIYRVEEDVRKPAERALDTIKTGRLRFNEVQGTVEGVKEIAADANKTLKDASDILEKARNAVIDAAVKFEFLPRLLRDLQNGTAELETLRSILAHLNPLYKERYVIPAQKHADNLEKQAEYLAGLFSGTRKLSEFPLRAVKAYQAIVDALDAAEEAAERADAAAEKAYNEAYPGTEDDLTLQAKKAKDRSLELYEEARKLRDEEVPGLEKQLDAKKKELDDVEEIVAQGRLNVDIINKELDTLPKGIETALRETDVKQKEASNKANEVLKKVNDIRDGIVEDLQPRLDSLKAGSVAGLENLTRLIEQARSDIRDATKSADSSDVSANRVRQKHNQMQLNLKELKDKILLARQKASSIHVALSADKSGHCVRSFKPNIEPTTTNNIILNYAINTPDEDSLLFFMGSSDANDFMAVEMVSRKIRFLWNCGGGIQMIQHDMTIETNDDQLLKNDQWFKIEVNRIGNIGTLSVKRTPHGQKSDPFEVTATSPAGFSRMDLDSRSHFYIGGLPPNYKAPKELKTRNFAGCLYELIVDGRQIGLWNFLTNEGCDACKEGVSEDADFSAYQFKGDGYAILPQIRFYNKLEISISLGFKTFSEDALIFLSPNPENGEFVSLELRGGHVWFQFNLGGNSKLTLKTKAKYNTGNWTKLEAARERLNGQMLVDEEFAEGNAPSGSPKDVSLDIQNSHLYYGGVPPTFSTLRWPGITFTKFLGCLRNLQVDTTPIDLSQSSFYGVDTGCKDKGIKAASFKGTGYLEYDGKPLPSDASFSFSFLTYQRNALLLLSTFHGDKEASEEKKQHYYSVALQEGKIVSKFNSGTGEITLSSDTTVNDGNFHTITLLKKNRKMFLRIDDEEVGQIRLPRGTRDLEAPSSGGLYLGGAKGDIPAKVLAASAQSLMGVIKDAVFNDWLLDFSKPVAFKGVDIGRSNRLLGSPQHLEQTALAHPGESCVQRPRYIYDEQAISFGTYHHDFLQVPVEKKGLVRAFNLTLQFRTHYPDGYLFLVRNERKKIYLSVMLQHGQVVVDMKSKKDQKELSSQKQLNDGKWHTVEIVKNGRVLSLSIDEKKNIDKEFVHRKLPLKGPLYLGGFPENIKLSKKVIFGSIKGCIKNLYINQKAQKLHGNSKAKSCFADSEPGAYFNGDEYALYNLGLNTIQTIEAKVHFKTTHLTGMLLHLGNAGGLVLNLGLRNGQVTAIVDPGEKFHPMSITKEFHSKYDMCDGHWHNVTVYYSHGSVSLQVDSLETVFGKLEKAPKVTASGLLYIGGLPDGVKKLSYFQDSFNGCIRNVVLNRQNIDWTSSPSHNTSPYSCPAF